MKYYKMYHRGSLEDALKTRKEITKNEFRRNYNKYHYKPYCYDKRINCYRYIISNMEDNYKQPTWLLIEVERNTKIEIFKLEKQLF